MLVSYLSQKPLPLVHVETGRLLRTIGALATTSTKSLISSIRSDVEQVVQAEQVLSRYTAMVLPLVLFVQHSPSILLAEDTEWHQSIRSCRVMKKFRHQIHVLTET